MHATTTQTIAVPGRVYRQLLLRRATIALARIGIVRTTSKPAMDIIRDL
jgi:hypothetical protein